MGLGSDRPVVPVLAFAIFFDDLQFLFAVENQRARRDTPSEEDACSDSGTRADHRIAAHDGCSCVDGNVGFDGWVPLFSFQCLTAGQRTRDQRDSLVKLHI